MLSINAYLFADTIIKTVGDSILWISASRLEYTVRIKDAMPSWEIKMNHVFYG